VSDLLDVAHYMFEQDHAALDEDQAKARDSLRKAVYVNLYKRKTYGWEMATGNRASGDSSPDIDVPMDSADMMSPATLPKYEHKPFIPATQIDVDSPLPIAGLKESPLG
jgi:hypothetical protein